MTTPWSDKVRSNVPPLMSTNTERLCAVIDAAISVVDEETEALQIQGGQDLARFSERKGQALISLSRWLQSRSSIEGHDILRMRLEQLRISVEKNRRILQIQMEAVSHVAQMIMRSVEADRSDGTYCQPRPPYGDF
jgi:hypothetical protein